MATLLEPEFDLLWDKDPSVLNAMRIRRALSKKPPLAREGAPTLRAAFLGSSTLDPLRDTFEITCLHQGIQAATFLGGYRQYPQEMLDENSPLYAFRPEITFLILDPWTVLGDLCFYLAEDGPAQAEALRDFLNQLRGMIRKFCELEAGLLVLHNLCPPPYDVMGLAGAEPGSLTRAIRDFNAELAALSHEFARVKILDYAALAARHGALAACDEKMRLLGRLCLSNAIVPPLARAQVGLAKALKGLARKCIVLDLDNTLWGGIVGEDGFEGIALGPTPPGNAYWEFQKTLLGFYRRGIILAIASRNNPEEALRVIREHPSQVLREEHFGAIAINWDDKPASLVKIARELNLGLDALVFVDDDPHNRQLVRQMLPQVLTPEMPQDPSYYARTLLELNDFESLALTEEDRKRGQMYAAERSRRSAREKSSDLEDFLRDLQTRIAIAPADPFSIPRIAQLTQRTNQFNMTTRRYSPADIEALAARPDHRVYALSAADRYGDSGLVGVAIVRTEGESWLIDTFLMSCRVLGRRIEDSFLWWIAKEAEKAGARTLLGEVIDTPKNMPARDFYERAGFTGVPAADGVKRYAIAVASFSSEPPHGVEIEGGPARCKD